MKISDVEHEIAEYENLKAGRVLSFLASDLDEFGEVVTKARIAKGWSQADLAEALGTHHQQIQRYERNDWQKINLWRLQEVVEVLGLDVAIDARLRRHEGQDIEPSQAMPGRVSLYSSTVSNLGLSIGEVLSVASASIGEALGNVGVGIDEVLRTLPTTIGDAVDIKAQAIPGTVHKARQTARNAPQANPEGGWRMSSGTSKPRFLRTGISTPVMAGIPATPIWQESENG